MKIFVSQLIISCECYHCQESIEEDNACVYEQLVYKGAVSWEQNKMWWMFAHPCQSSWRCCSFTVFWDGSWEKLRQDWANLGVEATLQENEARECQPGGFFFLWNIRNFQPNVTVCVCANLGRTHCICKAGQHFDISVIHCEVESHFKHTLAHCFLWVNYCFFWPRT